MMKIFLLISMFCLIIITGCTNDEQKPNESRSKEEIRLHKIIANGYGESKEKAVEDAKNDALRQFGYNIVDNNGKPQLAHAGKILNYEIIQDHSEQLQNGMWWEIKIQAEIEKL